MATATAELPDNTNQDPATYKRNIDATAQVHHELAGQFAVHESATPGMSIVVDGGVIFTGATLLNSTLKTLSGIGAPAADPRIDLIYLNSLTGGIVKLAGVESSSPIIPNVPAKCWPLAYIELSVGMTAITNAEIVPIRALPTAAILWESNTPISAYTFTASKTHSQFNVDAGDVGSNLDFNFPGLVNEPGTARFFRGTNTLGTTRIMIHRGDGSADSVIELRPRDPAIWIDGNIVHHEGNFTAGNKGWSAYKSAGTSYVPAGTEINLPVDAALYDDRLIHNGGTPGVVTIPTGVKRAALGCTVRCNIGGTGVFACDLKIRLNGAQIANKHFEWNNDSGYFDLDVDLPPHPVVAGDVVTYVLSHSATSARPSLGVLFFGTYGTAAYAAFYTDP